MRIKIINHSENVRNYMEIVGALAVISRVPRANPRDMQNKKPQKIKALVLLCSPLQR